VVVTKSGMRVREIGIERQPPTEAHVVRPLDAHAPARTAGLGRPRITDEHELRVEIEPPDRQRCLPLGPDDTAETELCAARADERRHPLEGLARDRIDAYGCPSRVIAVKPGAGVHVELCTAPGSGNETQLRTDDAGGIGAGVEWTQGPDVELIEIPAQSEDAS
jgi:hypothetical protein